MREFYNEWIIQYESYIMKGMNSRRAILSKNYTIRGQVSEKTI